MGTIIAVTLPKGKVGKTTTAINLAIAFTSLGSKTLLVDLDPAGFCAARLGFSKQDFASDIFNVMGHNPALKNVILKSTVKKLDFVQIKRLPFLDNQRFGELSHNEQILRNRLRPEAVNYDYVVMDCPPFVTGMINAALITADSILIPVAPGKLAISAVRRMIAHMNTIKEHYNPELRVEGILITMYELNSELSFSLKKELFTSYPKYTLSTSIPKNSDDENSDNNNPLLINNPESRAAKAYLKLAGELIERRKFS
jgi:chromosome partitioning protein